MSNRISRQIKLTDPEFDEFTDLSDSSSLPSTKQFVDQVMESFIQSNLEVEREQVTILVPSKSGKYRTIWMAPDVIDSIKVFADRMDVSQNAVIFTAVKQLLLTSGVREDA